VWAQDLRPHRRGRQVDLVSEVTVRGEAVWRGVSTYLSRGAEHPEAEPSEPPSTDSLAAVTAGPLWRLGEGTGRAYAAVSGDWNPIHVHALTARPLGFPSAIAHGMYSYARVLASLGPRLPEAGLTSHVWFRKPVRLPSSVRLRTAFEPSRTLSVLEDVKGEIGHAVVENTW
jgi:acyl dehydratase